MNKEQKEFINAALKGDNIFLTGAGGTGKSFIIGELIARYKNSGHTYGLTAMTGCAALLIGHSATTLHSWACVGLGKEPVSKLVSGIRKSQRGMRRWLLTDTLIVDEVSMMAPDFFEKLDLVAKKIRNSSAPFGKLQVIFVGDFFQLPPINKEGNSNSHEFIFESPLWAQMNFKIIELNEIMRQRDPVFHKILYEARHGKVSKESLEILQGRQNLNWKKLEIKPTLLFPQKAIVTSINSQNLNKLPGNQYSYKVSTVVATAGPIDINSQHVKYAIEKTNRDAQYDEEVLLKVGAQVMLLINMQKTESNALEHDLVNGSRGIVTGFLDDPIHTPLVKFQGFTKPIPIMHELWSVEDIEGVKQKQMPLKLAYALTIHKAQGATLDSALIDVGPNTFEKGQAYVALSRVKDLESLYLWDIEPTAFKAHSKVSAFYKSLSSSS